MRVLYHLLSIDGIEPWLDEKNLIGGEDWELKIRDVVRNSHVVIVCLSKEAANKAGFVQKEIRYALDIADEQPEGTIFLIPLRLELCNVPERLSRWHWVNIYEENGFENLMRALIARAEPLGISIKMDESEQQASSLFKPEDIASYAFDARSMIIGELFGLNLEGKFDDAENKLESYLNENPLVV